MKGIRGLLVALGLLVLAVTTAGPAQASVAAGAGTAPSVSAAVTCETAGAGSVEHFTLYHLTGYAGRCITFYGFQRCTAGYTDDEGLYDLRLYEGWDNETMSVHTYSQCDVRFYDSYNCPSHGDQTGWIDNSSNLGTWNNRPSCVLVS
ncbi:hypothetical protein [Amycolatopsis sp. lyj-23]|uniref:hypothetical protein n=1 Tax=Amycolatopsis sp. lyj-23 TaxID=2789283 RepID=UPI00397B808C